MSCKKCRNYHENKVFGFCFCSVKGKILPWQEEYCGEYKAKSKYNNVKTEFEGMKFDSSKEKNRYLELAVLAKAGKIKNLERQKRFEIVPKTPGERARYYCADFVYEEAGKTVIEDVKSIATAKDKVFSLKWALMKWKYPEYEYRIFGVETKMPNLGKKRRI